MFFFLQKKSFQFSLNFFFYYFYKNVWIKLVLKILKINEINRGIKTNNPFFWKLDFENYILFSVIFQFSFLVIVRFFCFYVSCFLFDLFFEIFVFFFEILATIFFAIVFFENYIFWFLITFFRKFQIFQNFTGFLKKMDILNTIFNHFFFNFIFFFIISHIFSKFFLSKVFFLVSIFLSKVFLNFQNVFRFFFVFSIFLRSLQI